MQSETSKIYLQHLLASALSALKLTDKLEKIEISTPQEGFGDYSTNTVLILAKKLKANPNELADRIIQEIKGLDVEKMFEEISSKNGFINFRLSTAYLAKFTQELTNEIRIEQIGSSNNNKAKKVLFEYSSPNTNKPLHIGHTRNDVYGKACINLLKATGFNVVTCEVINDRGIHIMKSILMYQKYGEGKTPESEKIKSDHFVGKFYSMFAQKAAESEDTEKQLLEEAQELLRKWEAGDAEVRKVWQQMNDWFFKGVKETYEREGSTFDEVDFESQIYDKGRDLALGGLKKGVFVKEADGSVSVDLTDKGLDKKTLLRQDGTTLYITQDMYLWHLRNERHHPDVAIVTTSAEQSYHFRVLKNIFELLNFPWAGNFKHLPYEHVFLGKDKMSSREGNTISADDLLVMIKEKVRSAMRNLEKIKQSAENEKLVEQVAFAAIKYGYLKYEPNTRIYFDIDQTIALEGNTGPYLQYAYSRIQSILKKAGDFTPSGTPANLLPVELSLMRQLLHYSESVVSAAENYKPNLLANYLYDLAAKFNNFYNEAQVVKEPDAMVRSFRLQIITATAHVLKNGLALLGIEAPEEM